MAKKQAKILEPLTDIIYTTEESAALLGISTKTILRKVNAGIIPAFKAGKSFQIKRGDLVAYQESRRVPFTTDT